MDTVAADASYPKGLGALDEHLSSSVEHLHTAFAVDVVSAIVLS
jgi:hypothetical protein